MMALYSLAIAPVVPLLVVAPDSMNTANPAMKDSTNARQRSRRNERFWNTTMPLSILAASPKDKPSAT